MTEPEPAFRRAQCPACHALCEQRRRSVWCDGELRLAQECIECEVVYVVAEQLSPLLPEGWAPDTHATHMPEAYVHTSGARVQRFCTDSPNRWTWYTPSQTYGAMCREPMPTMGDAMLAALAAELSPAERHAALESAYRCSNCRISSPRECAESGHLHCDTGHRREEESAPAPGGNPNSFAQHSTDPSGACADTPAADPGLRPGWQVYGIRSHAPDYWLGGINVFRLGFADDSRWCVRVWGRFDEPSLPTLEAAMQRAEELAELAEPKVEEPEP